MVLTWFVSQLTTSSFLVGLILPIYNGGWFLPQLLVSNYLQGRERKLPLYSAMAVVRSLSWALIALILFLWEGDPGPLLAIFFILLTVRSLATGLSGLSFMDVVGKTIPATRRGSFFARRRFLGGILALGGGLLVKYVLDERSGLPFPDNFALLFFLFFLTASVAMASFSLIVEPIEPVRRGSASLLGQFWRAIELLRGDINYRRFLATRLSLMAAEVAVPFYIIYAKQVLAIPAGMVGIYLIASTMMGILSNLAWGRISDQCGNRLVIGLTSLMGLLVPLLALLTLPLVRLIKGPTEMASYAFVPVFALLGLFRTGLFIGGINFLLDLAPVNERPVYIGFTNTLVGIIVFASATGGIIVDLAGLRILFYLAAVFYSLAIFFAWRLQEPRVVGEEGSLA